MKYSKKNKAFHFGKGTEQLDETEVDEMLTKNRDLRLKGGFIGWIFLVIVIIILYIISHFFNI
jgi:hypothetical protein